MPATHYWLPYNIAFRPPLICRPDCRYRCLLGLTLPCFAHRYEAIGTAYAGLPFIFVGHNRKIGWGMSQAGSDVQDLYVLTASGDGYTLDGATKAFETRTLHCTL